MSTGGERDILGLWAGDGGEGAKFWLSVLTEIKNRGVEDVCISVCDGLKGLPEAINTVWERAVVQTCIVHLIRNTFRFAARQYRDEVARDLRPVYTAPSEAAAKERFVEFSAKWGRQYPAITRLWENAWSEFVPFLDYEVEIRRVICSTNAIESLNARYRRAIRARGHFPTEQAALKCLYLATRALDLATKTGTADTPLRWNGQTQDTDSGLYYLRGRYYDPVAARGQGPDLTARHIDTVRFVTCWPQRTGRRAYCRGTNATRANPLCLSEGQKAQNHNDGVCLNTRAMPVPY